MHTLRKFVALLLLATCTLGARQQVVTGHNRQVGAPPCPAPTTTHRWNFQTANITCTGGCTNGNAITSANDVAGGGMPLGPTGSAPTPVFESNQINSLPAALYNAASSQSLIFTGVGGGASTPGTGTWTFYAVIRGQTGGSSNVFDIVAPGTTANLQWFVQSNTIGLNWRQNAVIIAGSSYTDNVWGTYAYTFDFTANTGTVYKCSAGTCSVTGSGSHTPPGGAFQPVANIGGPDYFTGYIAEVGWRPSSGSLADIGTYSLCKYGI